MPVVEECRHNRNVDISLSMGLNSSSICSLLTFVSVPSRRVNDASNRQFIQMAVSLTTDSESGISSIILGKGYKITVQICSVGNYIFLSFHLTLKSAVKRGNNDCSSRVRHILRELDNIRKLIKS